jgi:hypothetical protein
MMNNHNKAETAKEPFQSRSDKLKEIDSLYREQIKKIYNDSQQKLEKQDHDDRNMAEDKMEGFGKKQSNFNVGSVVINSKMLMSPKSASTLNVPESQSSGKMLNSGS